MLLDTLRRHSRSFIIYIFFGIIIAVFVVNFGPQSAGCTSASTVAGSIAGEPLTLNDFNYALSVTGLRGRALDESQMAFYKSLVMDQFIVRELLVEQAHAQGMSVSDKEIEDMLLKGRYLALGTPRLLVRGEKGNFDYDLFSRYVRFNWGTTAKKFKEQQRREILAERMRVLLRSAIKVSEDEVQADFLHRGNQAQLEYVRFSPSAYRASVVAGKPQVDAYLAANSAAIKAYYEKNKTSYTKLPKQVQLSQIRIDFAKHGGKAGAETLAKALHKKLSSGQDFAELAASSDDPKARATKGRGGWRNADGIHSSAVVKAAIAKLALGAISAPLALDDHFLIVKLEGRREGDLSLEQAQREIALFMLQDAEAKKLAAAAAQSAIDRALKGEKLSALFPEKTDKGNDTATPKLSTTDLFKRSPHQLVPGIGISKELMNLAFTLKTGEVAKKPITVGSMVYLVALKERKSADIARWSKNKDDIIDRYQSKKADERVNGFALKLCEQAREAGKLRVHAGLLAAPSAPGVKTKTPVAAYTPCKSLSVAPLMMR